MTKKERKTRIDNLYDKIFAEYYMAIKEWIIKNGNRTNPFIDKLSIDVSEHEIEMSHNPNYTSYIDLIEYIPEKDKLYFVIFNIDGTLHENREFGKRDINAMREMFNIIDIE